MTDKQLKEMFHKDGSYIDCLRAIYNKGRADAIEVCADLFAEILSNISNICGTNCPIKCNWGTEDTCKDMCKKWFIEQLKEQK